MFVQYGIRGGANVDVDVAVVVCRAKAVNCAWGSDQGPFSTPWVNLVIPSSPLQYFLPSPSSISISRSTSF